MKAAPSRVFLIDDDRSVRAALVNLLESVDHAVNAFDTIAAFLTHDRPDEPSCLVLDVRLPGGSGLDLQKLLNDAKDPIPIIFITGYGDIPMAVSAMKAGAVEFLGKPFREQDLLDAIAAALGADELSRQQRAILTALRQRHATLTPREREVLTLVADGQINKQVAAALGISEVTVKIHRQRVIQKMHATSLPALVRMVDRLELAKS